MVGESEYIIKAEIFLKEAKGALNRHVFWLSCFHAHQAVEFYVKGLLEMKTGSYPFTHDLRTLIKTLLVLGVDASEDILVRAEALTPHYTLARYGGRGVMDYDEERARRCVENAEVIIEWLRKLR